jgi:succinate dehydrogenase flavin-adding protein (antitoxin of CptAB toxin-antitoxin module)
MSKYVDLLDEDKPIAEQKFACLSFVSPEYIIKKKELFYFENFVRQYNFNKSAELLTQFSNFVSYKYDLQTDEVMEDLKQFVEGETAKMHESVEDDFKTFMDKNEDDLTTEFGKQNNFQTSTRGIKVRGVFPTQQEAEMRCKMLREVDPNHDVYVGPVGVWVPFHPEAYKTGRVEYLEKELNELMHEKTKNEAQAKQAFENRLKESKLSAIKENMEIAEKNDNKLTQTINEKGELVSVENMNTLEKNLGVNATMDDIQKELFEGDDVVMNKHTDHGLSDVLKRKEEAEQKEKQDTQADTDQNEK